MKKIKLLVGLLVAFVMLGAICAPTVSAQALHGVWLKCKVQAKGYTYDSGTGAYKKQNGSIAAYMHFDATGANTYDVLVYTNPGTGWANTYSTSETTIAPGENFISDFFLQFMFQGTDIIYGYHTPFIRYNSNGKIIYKGTGEIIGGSINGGALNYFGYFNISGTSVDSTKLPFTP